MNERENQIIRNHSLHPFVSFFKFEPLSLIQEVLSVNIAELDGIEYLAHKLFTGESHRLGARTFDFPSSN